MKSIKEIADITGVSKTTVTRYIKMIGATEAVQNGQTFLYDDAVVNLVIQEISKKDTETTTTQNISVNPDDSTLIQFEKTLQILEDELKEKNEQLKSKDEQIESLQTILNQQQKLLLYEQQKNTKLLEENIENKKWWQWWK
ncbi:hypothetical protein ACODH8_14350 [Vagococcus fluvialis]|uniref:hypothetical protein n=1 Tax=Vagococcus fluvialis TaxID=2738 RepID=UPI003B5ABCA3